MPNDEVVFDPSIYLPDDLGGASYVDTERKVEDINPFEDAPVDEVDAFGDFDETFFDDPEFDFDNDGDGDTTEDLDVPQFFNIVEQITRTAPDGTQVVDVTIDIQEVPRAVKYEVRLT